MTYPIALDRYDNMILKTLIGGVPGDPAELVDGDTANWEIVGVAAAGANGAAILLGHVAPRENTPTTFPVKV